MGQTELFVYRASGSVYGRRLLLSDMGDSAASESFHYVWAKVRNIDRLIAASLADHGLLHLLFHT